jgi:hypothetical protein
LAEIQWMRRGCSLRMRLLRSYPPPSSSFKYLTSLSPSLSPHVGSLLSWIQAQAHAQKVVIEDEKNWKGKSGQEAWRPWESEVHWKVRTYSYYRLILMSSEREIFPFPNKSDLSSVGESEGSGRFRVEAWQVSGNRRGLSVLLLVSILGLPDPGIIGKFNPVNPGSKYPNFRQKLNLKDYSNFYS